VVAQLRTKELLMSSFAAVLAMCEHPAKAAIARKFQSVFGPDFANFQSVRARSPLRRE